MKRSNTITFGLALAFAAWAPSGPSPQQSAKLQVATAGHPPADFRKIVDARLVQVLKDPDSRKVEFTATPFGGLVCGTVNAKNSYGGFTGGQPFYAVFDGQGNLSEFETYSDRDLAGYGRQGLIDLQFFRACGSSPI